ncbi:MAG TPA: hypothetical protein VIJ60_10410, partial [Acidimicrobiales bacterium]
DAADAALGPLREAHADELQRLADQAEALGDRGVPGRKEVTDRHHREERRWRTDELRVGLGVLARAYRDRLADAVSTPVAGAVPPDEGRGYATAVGLVTETAAALERNPNETLLLEALLVRLGRLD